MANYIKFTLSQIKYLLYLYRLSSNGCGVKNIELAAALRLSKPSVHNMLKSLCGLGMVTQEFFGLAHLTEKGYLLAQKYAFCFVVIEQKITELCGNGAASENAICGVLADMPPNAINDLYDSKNNIAVGKKVCSDGGQNLSEASLSVQDDRI